MTQDRITLNLQAVNWEGRDLLAEIAALKALLTENGITQPLPVFEACDVEDEGWNS